MIGWYINEGCKTNCRNHVTQNTIQHFNTKDSMILKTWSETVTVYKYVKITVSLDKNYSNGIWMTIYLIELSDKQFMQYKNKSSSYFIQN